MAKILSSPTKIRVLKRGSIPAFNLISQSGGTNLPFAFGHAFREGDIPSGSVALGANCTDWQCTPLTFWPDGSLKHAIVAGRMTMAANALTPIPLSAGASSGGTPLSETDLATALPAITISVGSHITNLKSLVNTSALHRTVCAGPVMSNWIYRQAVAGSNHLVVWIDVRLFKGGAIEIFPWIENGYLTVPNPINCVVNCSVAISGTQKFAQTIDIKHHTRVPLLTGTGFSYWVGTDPQITPRHDTSYLMAAKVVPNYPHGVTSAAYRFSETYTPNFIGDTSAGMGAAGFANHIGILPSWSATFLAGGGDPRAYRYVIANGLAAGSWSIHHRNELTNEVPTYAEFPKISITWGGSPSVPDGAGPVNTDGRGNNANPDVAHQPSLAYLPWILTARWYFLDELLFWDFWNYMNNNPSACEGAKGLAFSGQVRGRGWQLRTIAQAFGSVPSTHPSFASLKYSWESNTANYRGRYVDGTRDGGGWKNNLGCPGLYSGGGGSPYGTEGTYWWDAPWMQATVAMAFGMAWDMGLPQGVQSKADHIAARNFCYKQVVDRTGDGSSGTWNYRRFSVYSLPYSSPASTAPATWLPSWGAAYSVYEKFGGSSFAALKPLPSGTSMFAGDSELTGDSWSTSSGTCFNFVALVYAVEHGVPGADVGFSRITKSSSFTSAVQAWKDQPVWAIYPR